MQLSMLLRNQQQIVKLGLDTKDILIMDWIMEKSERREYLIDGYYYFKINQNDIIRDLPILGIKNSTQITRRLRKLCNAEFLTSENYNGEKIYKFSTNISLLVC